MSEADPNAPRQPVMAGSADLEGLDPGELLARGLHTVKPSVGASAWEPPTPEELGRLLPHYHIESLIGRGGMGAVYKGLQINLDRPVAIKLLPAEIAADVEFVTRFQREARTLAKLQHSRIVTIHDSGQTTKGHFYFVMEYVDGTDLRRILKGPGLDPEQALAVVGQLCDALEAAHREGIVHRDIKPENVLVTKDGYVKLADFGLTRPPREDGTSALTHTNIVMGTPDYMAPEQHDSAASADHRSDIFALGVMFYEMLTGRPPRGVFDPPSHKVQIDVRIDSVVLKALQSEPDRRYQRASELKTDVDRIRATPLPAPARSPAIPPTPRSAAGRPGILIAATFAFVTLCASGSYFLWWKGKQTALQEMVPVVSASPANVQPAALSSAPGPMEAAKDRPLVNSLGMKFVPVPILGGPTGGQRILFSVWDTRVEDYEAFVKDTKREWPKPDFPQGPTHPAIVVSWDDAHLFCQWLTAREQAAGRLSSEWQYRLPSDHEWSCGVELGAREDPARLPAEKNMKITDSFPWGTQWPPPAGAGNYAGEEYAPTAASRKYPMSTTLIAGYRDNFVETSPVGSFPANRFGLFDMGGNVMQWCEDWLDKEQKLRVRRGATWASSDRGILLSSFRLGHVPSYRAHNTGFRCILAPATTAASMAKESPGPSAQQPATVDRVGTTSAGLPAPAPREGDNALTPAEIAAGWKLLFNGQDLSGWSGDASMWSAVGGTITTTNTTEHQAKEGHRLIWEGGPISDFELIYKAMARPDDPAKKISGFFLFRAQLVASSGAFNGRFEQEVAKSLPPSGAMAWFPWGQKLRLSDSNDPNRPATQIIGPLVDAKEMQSLFKMNDWNDYKIIATGNHLRTFANEREISDLVDETRNATKRGALALAILQGSQPGTVSFKNIKLHVLTDTNPATSSQEQNHDIAASTVNQDHPPAAPVIPLESLPIKATKETPFVNSLGMKFVPVPGADALFSVWDTRVRDYAEYARSSPNVDGAWRSQSYQELPVSRDPDYPVAGVNWFDARAFCAWLTAKEIAAGTLPKDAVYRLPTDLEWSAAVGLRDEGGVSPKERSDGNRVLFSWGAEFPPPRKVANFGDETMAAAIPSRKNSTLKGYNDGFVTTSPVGSFPANSFGLFDMSGNLWQWCEDRSDPQNENRVLRGNCFGDWIDLLASLRLGKKPESRDCAFGFRCVLSLKQPNRDFTASPSGATSGKDLSPQQIQAPAPAGLANSPNSSPTSAYDRSTNSAKSLPATPPPAIAVPKHILADPLAEELQEVVVAYRWSFLSPQNAAPPKELECLPDGTVSCSTGEHWRWEVTGPYKLDFSWGTGNHMCLTFDKKMTEYEGHVGAKWTLAAKGGRLGRTDQPLLAMSVPPVPADSAPPPGKLPAVELEPDVHSESNGGPTGTNFGLGPVRSPFHASVSTNSPEPINLTLNCYWVVLNNGRHSLIPVAGDYPQSISCSAGHPFSMDINDDTSFRRNNGAMPGVGNPAGAYRGWLVCVHDASGKRVAWSSNSTAYFHLAP